MSSVERAREALQQHFGFTDFLEGQAEVIESVLAGHNAVVVMPTGGGKSLCYQLPAMMIDGVTLVVSPLIALMKDQVDQLSTRGIPTTFINSSLPYAETNRRLSEIRRGIYKLVYIAPERFRSQAFMDSIAQVKVRLFAVDEAHCISHWGHDFRPDYLRLKEAAQRLGHPQILALTATATTKVRADISEQLGLTDPSFLVAGFDRPNLALRVVHVSTDKEKLETVKRTINTLGAHGSRVRRGETDGEGTHAGRVRSQGGSGIIYTATRKSVEQLAAKLKMAGLSVEPYHGGMGELERTRAQDSFMNGRLQAIVATNAFGMGIDKRDIRFVIHYHIPGSIEAYYQEVGRAGRDGLPAECLLLFNYADTRTQQFFIEGNNPPPELIRRVYHEIASFGVEKIEMSARELAERLGEKNEMSIYSALVMLEKAGHIERGRSSDKNIIVWLTTRVDTALDQVVDDSVEGNLLRELVFNQDLNEREQTEVNLVGVSRALNLTDAQIRRALRGLSSRGVISYRNAYQGRGIKLLDNPPAVSLRIDTKELAVRASAEQWKLRRMIDYCYQKACLRRFILNYFGDRKKVDNCESCSVCAPHLSSYVEVARSEKKRAAGTLRIAAESRAVKLPPSTEIDQLIIDHAPTGEELRAELRKRAELNRTLNEATGVTEPETPARRSLNQAETIVVKKILSCVARLNGRFGKGTVAAVLRGSRSSQVIEHHLDKLSTYGLLKEMSQNDIGGYVKALIQARCIAVGKGVYPTVSLTDFGREVMASRAEVLLDLE
ncbi:MAG TPA: RecQ family ATP-dependent DNA helicase [Blastocatellia bacterium]|nr:RecQ family ATP-dependent DNA helicase [Blastocatellia bacterium]